MSNHLHITEVTNKSNIQEFIQLPVRLYKDCAAWIRPLDTDIESVFDRKKNKNFQQGICTRWILKKDKLIVGRIAAFINKKNSVKEKQPTGGIGFFECEDHQEFANLLFDTAKKWLEDQGIEAMDGPINFGNRNEWWGLLVNGFERQPNYRCNYNYPYYQQLLENYGFQVYFKQFTFGRNTFDPLDQKIHKKANLVAKDPNYRFEYLRKNNLDKYIEDFRKVYNKAWTEHQGISKMSNLQAKATFYAMKPIMDPKIIWFAYYKDEPIGFYFNLPEINQIFKHVNGKMGLWGKLIFVYHKLMKTNKKMLGVVFGITPKFQGKGVDGALIVATSHMVQRDYRRYPLLEMNWVGDFNTKMLAVIRNLEGDVVKTHHTYRYLFDRDKKFERMKFF